MAAVEGDFKMNENESLLDMYIFESEQLLEQLEQLMLDSEKTESFTRETINEVFRIMHTIKGSSAMMSFNAVSNLAHCMEDLFCLLRNGEYDEKNRSIANIADLVFEGIDFIKEEIEKAKNDIYVEGDPSELIQIIENYIDDLKCNHSDAPIQKQDSAQKESVDLSRQDSLASGNSQDVPKHAYEAVLHFEEGCEMENVRAYSVVYHLKDVASDIKHIPEDLSADECSEDIRKNGLHLVFKTDLAYDKVQEVLLQTIFLKDLSLTELNGEESAQSGDREASSQNTRNISDEQPNPSKDQTVPTGREAQLPSSHQNILSVDVAKLDKLMDLVGEMVIAEAMVVQNPDLAGLELNNFQKAAQSLDKITKEI